MGQRDFKGFNTCTVTIGKGKKRRTFTIIHDCGDAIEAAWINYEVRNQKNLSAEGFVNYINSKHVHKAITQAEYDLLKP